MIKIYFPDNESSVAELEEMLAPWGEYEVTNKKSEDVDFVICWGVSKMAEAFAALHGRAKLITYNWDCYEWVWANPRPGEYDYKRYGELLARSVEVWHPSESTYSRAREWGEKYWNHPMDHGVVIKSYIPYYDMPVSDGGYVLNALRSIPDRNVGMFERACKELNIPYHSTEHGLPFERFKNEVANCRFICVPFYENSTGGLSLLEAYYLGKPALVSDSPYQSSQEYLPEDRRRTFKWDDYEDFKLELKAMYNNPPKVAPDHKEWVVKNYHRSVMGKKIHERLQYLYANK